MEKASVLLSVLFVSGVSGACELPHLFITRPAMIQALTGSCVRIPCSFTTRQTTAYKSSEKAFGVWIKSDTRFALNADNVVFNGTKEVNVYAGEVTGKLQQKNCTTVFYNISTNYTDVYFFRIESKSFNATAACDAVHINVTASPPSPAFEAPGDLKEAESVTLTCSALTPCLDSSPRLSWNLPLDAHNELEQDSDGIFTTKIQGTFTVSDREDGLSVTCSALYEGQEEAVEKTVTLSVSYAPKNTLANIGGSEGGWVNLTCSSRANPPIGRFTWFKKNIDGAAKVTEGAVHTVEFTEGDVYFCVASNVLGNQTSPEIHLTGKPRQWELIIGGTVGIVGIVGIMVLVCTVVCICRLKSTRPTVQQTRQSPAGGEQTVAQSDGNKEGENIHYGQVTFSKRRKETSSSHTPQDSGQQQDTVYAQVKVSASTENHEDVYAQVKRK